MSYLGPDGSTAASGLPHAVCSLPFAAFFYWSLRTYPLDLCAGGNKLSSPLYGQSRLMSLVVAATIVRLSYGFGAGRVVQETHPCSLTGAD